MVIQKNYLPLFASILGASSSKMRPVIPWNSFRSFLTVGRPVSPAAILASPPSARYLTVTTLNATHEDRIETRILNAALPYVPQTGFTMTSLMQGIQSDPQLSQLFIASHTLAGLFPSGTKRFGQQLNEPIGPVKALAEHWLEIGNAHMKHTLLAEGITLQTHGIDGLRHAFALRLMYNRGISHSDLLEGLLLTLTPAEPFFGISLPFEPPHILPYGSHALDVSAAALAGLKDYSLSREWMLRRIRMAGVYCMIELSTLSAHGATEPTWVIDDRLRSLLEASESASSSIGETFEFINYVNRSSRAIVKSMGML